MCKISAILFDMDGVLVDATEWHYQALNRALYLFGFNISRYQHLSTYNGLPTRKKLEVLTVEQSLPLGLHEIICKLKQIYTNEEIYRECRPVFEKEYMISRLRREGYRLAVCSNSIRESVELMIRKSALYEHFDFLLSNEDISQPKPSPEIYIQAIRLMRCRPEEVVIVEDAPYGIEAAQRSGAHVCQVTGFEDVNYFRIKKFIHQVENQGVIL